MAHRTKAEQAEEQAFEATSILQAYTTRLIFVSDGAVKTRHRLFRLQGVWLMCVSAS